jgi:hypothetical protein
MAINSRYSDFGEFGATRRSELHWLNIDVQLRDIVFRRRRERDRTLSPPLSLSFEDWVLQGVGALSNALTVGRDGVDFDRFLVAISGQAQDNGYLRAYGLKQPTRLIWRRTGEASPRLEIAIPDNLSRRLIELYVSKRIDAVQLAMRLTIYGRNAEAEPGLSDRFLLLVEQEHRFSRRAQCELLSVYTSLGEN